MFRPRRSAADFSEELKAHLALETDRLRAEGLSEEEARYQARRNLGNLVGAQERFFESGRWRRFECLWQDARLAARRLRKAPGFTIAATLALGLGIGATTSIFTLVHAILLKSLPVSDPDRLYRLGREIHCCVFGGYDQDGGFSIVSYDLYQHLRDHTRGFSELAAFDAGGSLLGVRRTNSTNAAESYPAEFVSGNYFAMFGVNAWAGRALTAADDRPGAPAAAVMSYRVWQRKYGLDPSVIGGTFSVDDKPFTIVGVAPPGFYGDTLRSGPPDFFLPLGTEPLIHGDIALLRQSGAHWLELIGRVRPGIPVASIESQMRVELLQWLRFHIGDMDASERFKMPRQTLYLSPGGGGITSMRESYAYWLQILMMVSGFVLLIVCANVATLLLVRSMERSQQISLSMALGARTWRLVAQALTESVLLSLLGGAAGLAVAFAGTRLILYFAFRSLTAVPIEATPSAPILAFAFGVSVLTGILFGIVPAWMATRVDPVEALRGANRSTRRVGSLPRRMLVVVQAALSLALLSGAGLLTVALRNLGRQDFGFEQEQRTVVNIDPTLAGYKSAQLSSLYRRLHDSLTAIPGVLSVAACLYSPQSGGNWNDNIFVEGAGTPAPNVDVGASWDRVSTGYFETVGNPILKGRAITEQDTAASPHVAVVNEAFARRFFPKEDPIGKHFGRTDIRASREFEIVGVAKDARYLTYGARKPIAPFFFVPESQTTVFAKDALNTGETISHFLTDIVVRTRPGVALTDTQVRAALAIADPNLPLVRLLSLSEQVAGNFSQQRLIARLTSLFGVLALALAAMGLYGVTAYEAGSRTREIGVRMALGAERRNVLLLILKNAVLLIGMGLLLGIPLTLVAGRFLSHQLYEINWYDPMIMAGSILALGFAALIATLIPALRASSISPVQALRME